MGFVIMIAIARPHTVNTSCTLLKLSLSTSNVPDGATRVKNKSSPYANTSDVLSSCEGDVRIWRMFAT